MKFLIPWWVDNHFCICTSFLTLNSVLGEGRVICASQVPQSHAEDALLHRVGVPCSAVPFWDTFLWSGLMSWRKSWRILLYQGWKCCCAYTFQILAHFVFSSHLAMLLQSQDYKIAVGAVQMANVLIQKLPDTFLTYFHREGVMHHMKALRDVPLKMLATPKEEMGPPFAPLVPPTPTPPSAVPLAAAEASPQTPTSTRK